jgi:cell wall-associated NlpC family hydrolase
MLVLAAWGTLAAGQLIGAAPAQAAPGDRGSLIVATALKYNGYRYRFGGASPATGFDCSGFVYYVLNRAGVPVGRDMYSQFNSGPRVSTSNMRPGDLVFFSNTYKRGLSHAGIYIGNGRFIHAANESTGVLISNLWSSYWAAHFTAVVRPR